MEKKINEIKEIDWKKFQIFQINDKNENSLEIKINKKFQNGLNEIMRKFYNIDTEKYNEYMESKIENQNQKQFLDTKKKKDYEQYDEMNKKIQIIDENTTVKLTFIKENNKNTNEIQVILRLNYVSLDTSLQQMILVLSNFQHKEEQYIITMLDDTIEKKILTKIKNIIKNYNNTIITMLLRDITALTGVMFVDEAVSYAVGSSVDGLDFSDMFGSIF